MTSLLVCTGGWPCVRLYQKHLKNSTTFLILCEKIYIHVLTNIMYVARILFIMINDALQLGFISAEKFRRKWYRDMTAKIQSTMEKNAFEVLLYLDSATMKQKARFMTTFSLCPFCSSFQNLEIGGVIAKRFFKRVS